MSERSKPVSPVRNSVISEAVLGLLMKLPRKICQKLRLKSKGKRAFQIKREKIMDGLATWLGPGKVSDILAAVKDRDLWRDMIANAYKQGT
ncbi:hypothetical protein PoB_006688500 [Plakobranchus ocellatus]|uniref:Uncharacterized protein n=1 Tax=Plakobranchus ocellatus TaxID=259542 RepID=A0AAV4D8T1_9GAST|nr:hypothetical protein PoB_006688500 [Plakobranchus ocellatus]